MSGMHVDGSPEGIPALTLIPSRSGDHFRTDGHFCKRPNMKSNEKAQIVIIGSMIILVIKR